MNYLEVIPQEIVELIAHETDARSVARLMQTSHHLNNMGLTRVFVEVCHDWVIIAKNLTSVEFGVKYADKIPWSIIPVVLYKHLPMKIIREHFYTNSRISLNRAWVCKYSKLSVEFLVEFLHSANLVLNYGDLRNAQYLIDHISENQINLADAIQLLENPKVVNWGILSQHQKLTESFMSQYSNLLSWKLICQYQTLSENFIAKHIDKVTFNILGYQTLSYEFIISHPAILFNVYDVIRYQVLPMAVIEQAAVLHETKLYDGNRASPMYKHKMYNANCLHCEKLKTNDPAEKILYTFVDMFDYNYITRYQPLSEDFMTRYADRLNWHNVSKYQRLSPEFIAKFKDRLNTKHLANRGLI